MKAISLRKMVIEVVIICIASGYVRADKLQLQEKLSRNVKIQLSDVTIAQALKKIGETAEVEIILSDEAVWKLPYGEATRLSVTLSGPLADSLTEMLNAFFMRYAVGDVVITIYPRQELQHILGRPTTKQLELLKAIYANPIQQYFSGHVPESINDSIGQEIVISPIQTYSLLHSYLAELAGEEGKQKDEEVRLPIPVTLAHLLNQENQEYESWYVAGMDYPNQIPEIRVVSDIDFRQAKLDQVIDISFINERAYVILQRLAGWTGMELVVSKHDLSWLEEITVVDMQNITLKQALRNIVSSVDGEIFIDVASDEITIEGPTRPRKETAPGKTKSSEGAGEGYVGKISIPMNGGQYYIEFMLRESDLTEELKKLREEKIKEVIQKTTSE